MANTTIEMSTAASDWPMMQASTVHLLHFQRSALYFFLCCPAWLGGTPCKHPSYLYIFHDTYKKTQPSSIARIIVSLYSSICLYPGIVSNHILDCKFSGSRTIFLFSICIAPCTLRLCSMTKVSYANNRLFGSLARPKDWKNHLGSNRKQTFSIFLAN